MEIGRRALIAAGGAAAAVGGSQAASAVTNAIDAEGGALNAVKVSIGGDGKSIVDMVLLPADPSPYPLFKQFLTHKASATAIYRAPPHHLSNEAQPTRDLLFIVSGGAVIAADTGRETVGAGSVALCDAGARHSITAGPSGYTAIRVRLAG